MIKHQKNSGYFYFKNFVQCIIKEKNETGTQI